MASKAVEMELGKKKKLYARPADAKEIFSMGLTPL